MTRRETMDVVSRYMGTSPVPPAWTYAGVLGTFGKRIARLWARHLRHRLPGVYRDPQTRRYLHPVVQTVYDFGLTPEQLIAFMSRTSLPPAETPDTNAGKTEKSLLILDESHSF
jgi:hypothetical protein